MITCYLRYEVPLGQARDFEAYAAMWLDLVPRFGGTHHGYFLPSEGETTLRWRCSAFQASRPTSSTARTPRRIRMFQKAIAFVRKRAVSPVMNRPFFGPLFPKTA